MDLNATILGQMISFIIFVWFCMKYIWPKIIITIENRKQAIEIELLLLEKYKKEIQFLKTKSLNIIDDAKKKSKYIIQNAQNQKNIILEEAENIIQNEKEAIISQAYAEIKTKKIQIRNQLMKEINTIAILMANKIIHQSIDNNKNTSTVIDVLIKNL